VALAALAALTAVAGLALAGCSTSGGSSSSAPADRKVAEPAQAGGAPQADAQPGQPGAPAATGKGQVPLPAPTDAVPDQRTIIYTGAIAVRVSDVDKAATAATALATGAGGFVGGDQRSTDDDRSQAQLVLRIPSAKFQAVIDGLAKLGKEATRQLSTEDVTAKAVDLDSRITTAQASVDRVRSLMAKAQNIGEIVSLESELSRREADLESLKSQLRKLNDLATLSTITVTLLNPKAPAPKPTGPDTGFLAGLKTGWRAFVVSLNVLLTVLGAVLPWLLILGLPPLLVFRLTRRLRRRAAVAAPPAAAE
jgi:hypothetical protein